MTTCALFRYRDAVLLLLALLVASCSRAPAIEKTSLTRLPAGYVRGSFVASTDGTTWAFIEDVSGGQRVVSPTGAGPTYARCSRVSFAPKTNRLFYWGKEDASDAQADPVFTLVADGVPMRTALIAAGDVQFSEDGTRWTAIGAGAPRAAGEVGAISLLVDGREMTRQTDMSMPAFSPDGAHVAYLTRVDDRVRLFIDGVERRAFEPPNSACGTAALAAAPRPDIPMRHGLKYLADGSLLVVTRDPDGWGVYQDGLRLASYPVANVDRADPSCAGVAVVAPRSVAKAERAPAAFWWERVEGDAERWRMVRNGRPVDDVICKEPWRRHPPEPSADGTRVVYACAETDAGGGARAVLVRADQRWGPYTDVWGIAPTKDGTHVAYGAATRESTRPWALYVDGEPRFRHVSATWRPRVSDDGAMLAWEAKRDDADTRGIFGLNGRVIGSFDDVLWGPELDGARAVWIVRRGRTVARISVPFAAADRATTVRVVAKPPRT